MTPSRVTVPTRLVLQFLLADPEQQRYALEIGTAAGLPSGTVHPILARLERIGWLASRWEDIDVCAKDRPARRYYRLTAEGVVAANAALARASRRAVPIMLRPLGGTA